MSATKSPLERALDLLLYAPLGLAVTARDQVPKLVDVGRQRLGTQIDTARMMGQLAVTQGQREAERVMKQVTRRLSDLGLVADGDAGGAEPGPPSSAGADTGVPEPPSPADAPAPPAADHLAIPGYDALSASQVVQRLAGLSADELEAVRLYELATRRRKTILSRIDQLQSAPP